MSHAPPVPAAAQSPYPIQEPPHAPAEPFVSAVRSPSEAAIETARNAVSPLAAKATKFARERPYATAALLGTIALAVFNSLRGVRAARR